MQISEFMPKDVLLFRKQDSEGNALPCPIPGMEEVYVRIIPPDFRTEEARDAYINGDHSVGEAAVHQIWLTFGGTNMVVVMQKRDSEGRVIWEEKDGEYVPVECEVKFNLGMTEEQFKEQVYRLPLMLVNYWYARMLEVVRQWQPQFPDE